MWTSGIVRVRMFDLILIFLNFLGAKWYHFACFLIKDQRTIFIAI